MHPTPKRNTPPANPSARRSQRRISKLLDKNISEYQIPNPYRNTKTHPQLPKNLSRQLSRLDYFSVRSLQNLRFKEPTAHEEITQLLLKMRSAVQKQTHEFDLFVASETLKVKKHSTITTCNETQKEEEDELDQLHDCHLQQSMHHDQGKEIELEDLDKYERNLPLVFEPSEAESVLEDNCEGGRFEFHLERHWEVEQPIELYYS